MLLLPANEVWGKVIFSQACLSHSVHRGGSLYDDTSLSHVPSRGGLCPGGQKGGTVQGGTVQGVSVQGVTVQGVSVKGVSVRETPHIVKSGGYISYWNAFLFCINSIFAAKSYQTDIFCFCLG